MISLSNPKVGGQAFSTLNIQDWMNTPVPRAPQKPRKTKGGKQVVDPVFEKSLEHIDDPYWQELLSNASKGLFPKRFSYKEGILYYKRGNRLYQAETSNSPYEAASIFMDFLRRYGGLMSERDQAILQEEQHLRDLAELAQEEEETSWADFKKKVRATLIDTYIEDTGTIRGLSSKEKEQLRHVLAVGVALGYFHKDNITIRGRRIDSIGGLLFNGQNRSFYIDPTLQPKVVRSAKSKRTEQKSSKDKVDFLGKWAHLLEDMDKTAQKYGKAARVSINKGPPGKRVRLVGDSTGSVETPVSDYESSLT
jgi:hypothetical protein